MKLTRYARFEEVDEILPVLQARDINLEILGWAFPNSKIAFYCLFCVYVMKHYLFSRSLVLLCENTLVCLIIVGSNNSGQWPKSPKPNISGQLKLIVLVPIKRVLRAKTENLIIMAHDY